MRPFYGAILGAAWGAMVATEHDWALLVCGLATILLALKVIWD